MEKDFKRYEEITELLKAIAHPVRLCIIKGLLESGGCNVSHMQNCLEIPQSTISQHLQKLKSVGIIEGDRKGLEITYSIKDERIKKIIETFLN